MPFEVISSECHFFIIYSATGRTAFVLRHNEGVTTLTEQNRTELYYHKQNTYGRLPE